jgi:type III pantothenate kinase
MIGLIDIGNTRTKLALHGPGGELLGEKELPTGVDFQPAARALFAGRLRRAVIGSVVPALNAAWMEFLQAKSEQVHLATHASPWGFRIGVESPERVGIDRLANMEGALSLSGAVLVVDAGTATKFDLLEGVTSRTFAGGAIAPGLMISYNALIAAAAQLPQIDLGKVSPVVGYNTETAIRSGVLHGFASLVDGMVMRIFEERGLPSQATVVATGGNSLYLQGRARLVSSIRPRLTMEGLYGLAGKI